MKDKSGGIAATIFALLLCSNLAAQLAPSIAKVDPPNWWWGLPSPMLLLKGENLDGARVTTTLPGIHVARTVVSANGHYVMVWLRVDARLSATGGGPPAKAGGPPPPSVIPLKLQTARGNTLVKFPMTPRRSPSDAFQGLNEDDVIYLIMPDRFADGDPGNDQPPRSPQSFDRANPRAYHGGDLRGIRDHLPYLHDLGVTTLWLNPVYANSRLARDYHGYGAVDFYGVDEHLGSLGDFNQLVSAAHQMEMKVFLDLVPNHTGPRHPWVDDPPEPHWFHGARARHLATHMPFAPVTDPHSVPRQFRELLDGWFADILPDLNQENPDTSQYLIQNALWWAEEAGLDGFRLDTFPFVSRRFWADFHAQLHQQHPRFFTVGEVFDPDPVMTSFFAGGQKRFDGVDSGLDTVFDFPLYFAIRDVTMRGASAEKIENVLGHDWLYPHPGRLVTFIGNHDVARFITEAGGSKDKLMAAFSLLATLRGIPQIYSGDEIGMPGAGDPDNRRDFPGGFPGDTRNAFTAAGRTVDEQEIFAHLRSLLLFRRRHPALRGGDLQHIAAGETTYAFLRSSGADRLLCVFNNQDHERLIKLDFSDTPLASARALLPAFAAGDALLSGGHAEVKVAARSVAIYQVQ